METQCDEMQKQWNKAQLAPRPQQAKVDQDKNRKTAVKKPGTVGAGIRPSLGVALGEPTADFMKLIGDNSKAVPDIAHTTGIKKISKSHFFHRFFPLLYYPAPPFQYSVIFTKSLISK